MTSYGTAHPLDMVYDMAHIFFVLNKQVPDPRNLPSIGLHPSWFIPHFFLIPVLESQKDNLDIQVKFGGLPSMSSLSPLHIPLSADNMEIQDNLRYFRPLARTTSI